MTGEDRSTKASPTAADESRAVDDFPALPDTPPSTTESTPESLHCDRAICSARFGTAASERLPRCWPRCSRRLDTTSRCSTPGRTNRATRTNGRFISSSVKSPSYHCRPARSRSRPRITFRRRTGLTNGSSDSPDSTWCSFLISTGSVFTPCRQSGLAWPSWTQSCTSCCTAPRCGTGSKIASRSTTSRIWRSNILERRSIEWADALVSPSRYLLDWAKDWGFRLPAQVFVHPYASHRTEFRAGSAALRSRRLRSSAASKRAKAWKSSVRLWRFSRSEAPSTGVQSRFSANPGVPGSKMEQAFAARRTARPRRPCPHRGRPRPGRRALDSLRRAERSQSCHHWPTTRRTPFSSALQRRYRLSPPAPVAFRKSLPSPIEKTRSLLQRQRSSPSASSVHSVDGVRPARPAHDPNDVRRQWIGWHEAAG